MACGESILKDGIRGIESVINAVVGEVDLPQVVMNASGGKITKEQVLAAVKERQLEMIKQKLIAMSKGG
jgi:methyltransferase-like protein